MKHGPYSGRYRDLMFCVLFSGGEGLRIIAEIQVSDGDHSIHRWLTCIKEPTGSNFSLNQASKYGSVYISIEEM